MAPATLPITADNLHDWFPSPHVENPLAGDPWWQLNALGLLCALQYLRLLPDNDYRQQALIELRRSLDTGLLTLPQPADEAIARRMAQTLAPWCPSPYEVVEAMLALAQVGPGDVLLDLGCGDGRIVFAAAHRGARAVGVDIDARFIAECQERRLGPEQEVADRVSFAQGDILTVDFGEATVISCYLLTSSMAALQEKFAQLPPGTRIISHAFRLDGWPLAAAQAVADSHIYLYTVPDPS